MKNINKKAIWIALWILLGLTYVTLVIFIDRYIDGFLDYDLSAELIAGKIMAEERSLIAKDWFFSTELRVLNVPLVFSLFFHFFDSWHTVRVVSSAVLNLILVGGVVYSSFNMGLKKYAPVLGIILILPFSCVYMEFVVCGLYYIPHIATSLFTMGMFYSIWNHPEWKKRNIGKIIFLFVLSFVTGMGGYRLVVNLYLPMIITLGIMYYLGHRISEKNKWFVYAVAVCFVSAMLGILCNKYMHNFYSFEEQVLRIKYLDVSELGILINPILKDFGFKDGPVTLWPLIRNCSCFMTVVLLVFALIYHFRNGNDADILLSIFFIVSMVVMFGVFLITEQRFFDRYYLPVLVYAYFLIFRMISNIEDKKCILKYGIAILFLMIVCLNAYNIYKEYKYHDINKEVRDVREYLLSNGYTNGYSTGFYSGPLTELSDGKIDVWKWVDGDIDNQISVDILKPWLQKKSHMTDHPKGKVFVLLDKSEYAIFPARTEISSFQVYETEGLMLFGFESYEQCKDACAKEN